MGDKRSIKTNENLAWHLLLGVGPPPQPPAPLMAQISIHFLAHFLALKVHFKSNRPPTAYDNHPFHPTIHPIRPSTYSCEDDLSIEDLI